MHTRTCMYAYLCIIHVCVYSLDLYLGGRLVELEVNKIGLGLTPHDIEIGGCSPFTDGLYTKGTLAHTHRELIREWL